MGRSEIGAGVFFIGLGILFFTHIISFWPGILFVLGASALARGMAEGQHWQSVSGGLFLIGLGLVFLLNFSWPIILILIGLAMLFGYNFRSSWKRHRDDEDVRYVEVEKPKNDDKLKNEDLI